ncbi:MAG: DNA alkylation repair protein [Pseudomonadota bacterium]
MAVSKATLDRYLREVTERITTIAGRTKPYRTDPSGMGRLRTISTPQQRTAGKAGYSFTRDDTPRRDQLVIWDHVWRHAELMEVMHQALYAYQHRVLHRYEIDTLRRWIDRCSCWEHSDDLSKIFADALEPHPEWLLPTLQTWTTSNNPWKRRQSVVALIEYASKRKRFLPWQTLIDQVTPLLADEDYYVQKGVGWTIREIGNAYPEKMERYLDEHLLELSAQAYAGVTKNMEKPVRNALTAQRRKGV